MVKKIMIASQEGNITQQKHEGCFWGDGNTLCVYLGVIIRTCKTVKTHYTEHLRFVHFLHVNYASILQKHLNIKYERGSTLHPPMKEQKKKGVLRYAEGKLRKFTLNDLNIVSKSKG